MKLSKVCRRQKDALTTQTRYVHSSQKILPRSTSNKTGHFLVIATGIGTVTSSTRWMSIPAGYLSSKWSHAFDVWVEVTKEIFPTKEVCAVNGCRGNHRKCLHYVQRPGLEFKANFGQKTLSNCPGRVSRQTFTLATINSEFNHREIRKSACQFLQLSVTTVRPGHRRIGNSGCHGAGPLLRVFIQWWPWKHQKHLILLPCKPFV